MLAAKNDSKINGERIDSLLFLFWHRRGSTCAWRRNFCAFTWRHLCAPLCCEASCVDRWPFTTEAHLAGARCNGAATARTNAAANLV